MLIRSRCVQIFIEIIPITVIGLTVLDTCYGDKQMDVYWNHLSHVAEVPTMAADPFFLFLLANILGRPIVLHGQRPSAVPVGKSEMRG